MKEFWNKVRSTVYLHFIPKCLVLLCLNSLLFACVVEEGVAELNYTQVTVTTANVSLIRDNSAVCGGKVTAAQERNVVRGVCWGIASNPTIADSKTIDGTGNGAFTSSLTGLISGTTYYVRAYATNSLGTAYANEVSFATAAPFVTKIINVTNPITGKTWMDRNLGANRAAISSSDEEAYGDLYQWGRGSDGHERRTSGTISSLSSNDTPGHDNFISVNSGNFDWCSPQNNNFWQGVNGKNNPCPTGYRLPTSAELEAERASWSSQNSEGAFASLIKLPLAGYRSFDNGSLYVEGSHGLYWSGTVYGTYAKSLYFSSSTAYVNFDGRARGMSVRCIKDVASSSIPTVITSAISSVTSTTATSGGNVTSDGGATVTAKGVCWSTTPTPTTANSKTTDGTSTGSFTSSLSGLSPSTTYYVRAFATNSVGTSYGNELSFTTTAASTVSTVTSSTGKVWMDRNLGASRAATSSTDEQAYGDLYQWGRGTDGHEKRTSGTTSSLSSSNTPGHGNFITSSSGNYDWCSSQNDNLWQGVNGINNPCPTGFRIPTIAEWEAERTSWSSNNSSGSFASPLKLPVAGYRLSSNGTLSYVGSFGHYWSATQQGGYAYILDFGTSALAGSSYPRSYGYSVRCLKDN
jgi:uncharacterized protein (TIGR02145 family)